MGSLKLCEKHVGGGGFVEEKWKEEGGGTVIGI